MMAQTSRVSWLDETSQTPVIEQQARQLQSFIETLADGRVDDKELQAQEARVAALMKEIEPLLNDALHAKVTQLLCEMTAYDLMQMLSQMQPARAQWRP